jgi:hypothetical protein
MCALGFIQLAVSHTSNHPVSQPTDQPTDRPINQLCVGMVGNPLGCCTMGAVFTLLADMRCWPDVLQPKS